MNITDIKIRKTDSENRVKAVASVTFDDEFVVHDIKILDSNDGGYFIAMPSRKLPDGNFKDIAHPITSDFRRYIQDNILEAFKELN